MIVVMCGMPTSGKSTIVDNLFNRDDHYIIRPSDFVPENTKSLSPQLQQTINIESWNISIDKAREFVHKLHDTDTIVLDMCNKDASVLHKMLLFAKKRKHRTVLLFVNTTLKNCKARAENLLADDVYKKYIDAFQVSLPQYKKICDLFLVIDNNESHDVVISKLSQIRSKLCLNTKTPTSMT